jgi:hypothetical protein
MALEDRRLIFFNGRAGLWSARVVWSKLVQFIVARISLALPMYCKLSLFGSLYTSDFLQLQAKFRFILAL